MTKNSIPKAVEIAAARGPVTLNSLGRAPVAEEKVVVPYQPRNQVHLWQILLRQAFTGWMGGGKQP